MSQQRVKFPDIWVVYRPFQKQTLNSHPIIFNIRFMFNFRDPTFNANNKPKIAVFSSPVSVNRALEEPSVLMLTNKQSVYGLILDELMQYYKFLPLELDFSFLKSMRKVHNKGEELAGQEQLQRAAEILIQAKNKVVKEQISLYKLQCDEYLRRCPNALASVCSKKGHKPKEKLIKSRKISSRQQFKKVLPQQRFIERIRSQGKQQNLNNPASQKRSSFLLHPNLIRFQSSNPIIKKAHYSKEALGWRLPRIVDNNRMLQDSICSSLQKSKHIRVFFSPLNRSSNTERAVLLRNILFSSKHSNVSGNSFQKQSQKDESVLSRDRKAAHEVSLQLQLPKREDEPKKNRKLMLQLLREKSKQALLSD